MRDGATKSFGVVENEFVGSSEMENLNSAIALTNASLPLARFTSLRAQNGIQPVMRPSPCLRDRRIVTKEILLHSSNSGAEPSILQSSHPTPPFLARWWRRCSQQRLWLSMRDLYHGPEPTVTVSKSVSCSTSSNSQANAPFCSSSPSEFPSTT